MANELVLENGVWKFRAKIESEAAGAVGLLTVEMGLENALDQYSVSLDQTFSLPLIESTITAAGIFYLTSSTMVTGSIS